MSEENTHLSPLSDNNLSSEQTDKLLQFQEITHKDSIEECKHFLEACNWNIELAIQSAFAEPNDSFLNRNQIDLNNTPISKIPNQIVQSNQSSIVRNLTENNLPAVNILTQRTFSYYNQEIIPRGIFGWGYFLIAFPLRFVYSTIFDIVSYFWNIFGSNNSFDKNSNNNYDPLANIAEFAIEYNKQYGVNKHPKFYEGSYAQAVNQAKRDLKFLLIYLHQINNNDCIKLATETLGNQDVIDFINNMVLFWACSIDLPEGKKVFTALKAKRCPFLGLIVLKNNKMTLVTRIEGPIKSEELMHQLNQIINDYQIELETVRLDRETMSLNQKLREQQDQAYAESLRLDQEKVKKQREEEEIRRKALEVEKRSAEEQRIKENELFNRKIELRKKFEEELIDSSNINAIKLLVKLPNGRRLERIFLKTDPLKNLYNFVFSNDECPKNFEIVTNFPRKVIQASHECETSLENSGINQSMLLFVNDLDA